MSDWHSRTLQEIISTIESGTRPKGGVRIGENSEGVPSYGGENISMNGGMLYDSVRMVPTSFATEMRRGVLSDKDVLINKDGANTGKSAIYRKPAGEKFATINEHLFLLRCNQGIAEQEFLYHFLNSEFGKSQIAKVITGSAQPGLNSTFPEFVRIDLPPLPEQKKIAEILSGIDALIASIILKKIKIIQQRQSTAESLFFCDSSGKNSFTSYALQDLSLGRFGIVDGPFGSNLKSEHYREKGVPVIQSGFVTRGKFFANEYKYVDEEKYQEQIRSSVSGGDIVMAKIGANAGRSALMPLGHPTGILAGNCLKITPDEELVHREYLLGLIEQLYLSGKLANITNTTAQPAVSMSKLKKFLVSIPDIASQEKVVDCLRSLDGVTGALEKSEKKLICLKDAFASDLLSGRKRVSI